MMSFGEYMEAMQAAMPTPLCLNHPLAATLATPGKDDTRRAIERAAKRGRAVTPYDLRAAVSPESHETAKAGVLKLATAQLSRTSGSTSGPMGFAGGPSGD